jgi:transcriptional regulator with XRE-family HTH domain
VPKRKQNEAIQSPFSRRLSVLRKEKGLNMEKLAQAIAVSKSYISLLEAGERQPSREVVLKLAEVLFPEGNSNACDELLILAGFAPRNNDAAAAYRDAISTYEQSLIQMPQDFSTYLRLVFALIKAGRLTQAQEKIQQGLQLFSEGVQLQALLSSLELSRGNYAAALLNQETAIQTYEMHPERSNLGIRAADLHFNLGAIYFLRGYDSLGSFLAENKPEERQQALTNFAQAAEKFEYALKLCPEDVFICDEYARLSFNQAFLLDEVESKRYWERTIEGFKQVLISPDKQNLGQQTLLESGAFLAHAYAKSGRFDEAELTLGLLDSFNPGYWLTHYIEACFCSLHYGQDSQKKWLDRGLKALQTALKSNKGNNPTRSEARHDPDLNHLRNARKREFAQILNQGEEV